MAVEHRILVLRATGIGDLLTAIPAFRAIRRGFPDSWIVAAIPRPLERLIADCVDEVIDVRAAASAEGLAALSSYEEPINLAINLHGRGPESHRALLRLHPERLIAFACEDIDVEGPPWLARQHEVERWCDLVNITLHVDADPDDLRLALPEMHRDDRLVVIHAGASRTEKQWPWERVADLAKALAGEGHVIALTGDDGDRETVDRIRSRAGLPIGSALAGTTDMDALISLLARASLLVAPDTGVGHLATALGTPSVLLFGVTDPARWGPRMGPHRVVTTDCADSTMTDIDVATVLHHCRDMLHA
jgi:ADP-heptose:LPS heptosyltransferase